MRADAGPAVELIAASLDIMPMAAIHSMPRLPNWHAGRMIIIGDAAPRADADLRPGRISPIEDAVIVAKCLRDAPDAPTAFRRFEAARRHRVERIVKSAPRISRSKAARPIARMFRDAALPTILKRTSSGKALPETFDYHSDWNTPLTPE